MRKAHALNKSEAEVHFHEPGKLDRSVLINGLGPAPETSKGVIACYCCPKHDDEPAFTLHQYHGRKTISSDKQVPLYHELYFKCSQCGQARVWGTEIITQ